MIEIEVTRNTFGTIAKGLDRGVADAVTDATQQLQVEIGKRSGSKTIKRSLRRRVNQHEGTVRGVWWWHFTNYGTRYQPARGFAQQAVVAVKPRFYAKIMRALTGE